MIIMKNRGSAVGDTCAKFQTLANTRSDRKLLEITMITRPMAIVKVLQKSFDHTLGSNAVP